MAGARGVRGRLCSPGQAAAGALWAVLEIPSSWVRAKRARGHVHPARVWCAHLTPARNQAERHGQALKVSSSQHTREMAAAEWSSPRLFYAESISRGTPGSLCTLPPSPRGGALSAASGAGPARHTLGPLCGSCPCHGQLPSAPNAHTRSQPRGDSGSRRSC